MGVARTWLVALGAVSAALYLGWLLLVGDTPPVNIAVAIGLLGAVTASFAALWLEEGEADRSLEEDLIGRWLRRQRGEAPPGARRSWGRMRAAGPPDPVGALAVRRLPDRPVRLRGGRQPRGDQQRA